MDTKTSVPLVYIGGPARLRLAARRYLLAQGCRRWTELAPCGRSGSPARARWSRQVLEQALRASRPGQQVLILAPPACYQGWAPRLERRGRRVDTPLAGLTLGQMLWELVRTGPVWQEAVGAGARDALAEGRQDAVGDRAQNAAERAAQGAVAESVKAAPREIGGVT